MTYSSSLNAIPPAAPEALLCLAVFALSYLAVLFEESIHLRKSKPMTLGAGIIWTVIALAAPRYGVSRALVSDAVSHALTEYAGLLLFLLVSMVFISALEERNVFAVMRASLMRRGFGPRGIFWLTGALAFALSAFANNLTTALVVGAIIVAAGKGNRRFVVMSCVNAVSAANAGGLASPFGDITTLMVWQSGHLGFFDFFRLLVPALAAFLIPAAIMARYLPKKLPPADGQTVTLKPGAWLITALGLLSIVLTVVFQQALGLPPYMGMMVGMALLMMASRFLITADKRDEFDVLRLLAGVEWDTLLFFFGVIFSVAGLSFLGYIDGAAALLYGNGAGVANIGLGLVSAVVDNIPIMYAVLSMHQDMDQFQWLLVTLTTGLGGTLLSVGSAAGVALMGVARGQYTFKSHLKWTPVLLLGYCGAIVAHFALN
jgi:Na+/H+ antiporter NhaD/arsenite permease-like protein